MAIKEKLNLNGIDLTFKGWRFKRARGHDLPAQLRGKDVSIPQEALYTDSNGTEIGFHADNPIIKQEKSVIFKRKHK